jgi:hypothetical protein
MKRATRKSISVVFGSVLIVGSCLGIVKGSRAGAAQSLYCLAKSEPATDSGVELAAATASKAYRLYPHNYYYSVWMGERAYYQRFDPFTGKLQTDRLKIAEQWCEAGLRQNYYDRQLRALKAMLLVRHSPAAAAEYWADYVEWDFWDPHHHRMLVELHALAGDYDRAVEELEWTRRSPEVHEEANRILRKIIAGEARRPVGVPATNATVSVLE